MIGLFINLSPKLKFVKVTPKVYKMIFKTPFETTSGSMADIKSISKSIEKALVMGDLRNSTLNVKPVEGITPVYITGKDVEENDISLYSHSISIIRDGEVFLCTDLRTALNQRKLAETGSINESIRNSTEYKFLLGNSILGLKWMAGEIGEIKAGLVDGGWVFATVLSDVLARNYALDIGDRIRLNVLSLLYYNSLFTKEWSDDVIDTTFIQAKRFFRIDNNVYSEVVANIPADTEGFTKGLASFCEAVGAVLQSERLASINPLVVLTLFGNVWYGNNAKSYIGVALEHPPTWLSILYASITERTFKSSLVFKTADSLMKGNSMRNFIMNYSNIMSDAVSGKPGLEHMSEIEVDAALEALEPIID